MKEILSILNEAMLAERKKKSKKNKFGKYYKDKTNNDDKEEGSDIETKNTKHAEDEDE
jgi:tRNA 2-selenouridine synthase SelU